MEIKVFQGVVPHERCHSFVRGDLVSSYYPVLGPLTMDGLLDLVLRRSVLFLGVRTKEPLIPCVLLGAWGSRVTSLSSSTPLKLSLDSFARCSGE